jgi:pectate lyase
VRLKPLIVSMALVAGAVLVLPASLASAAPTRFEAESSPATCTGTIDSNWAGFSGSGFCNGTNAVGASAQFTVNASTSGTATLGVRFANGTTTARPAGLIVNGSTMQTPSFEGTGAWSTWATKTLSVSVSAGSNTIRLNPTTSNGLPNVDYLDFEVGGSPPPPPPPPGWPTPTGQVTVNGTISVSGVLDGGLRRYCCIGDGSQEEDQDPMFELASGATLQNVIIGAPAGDGVHCSGSCTLRNVWWEDVGEDAATFRGSGSPQFLVDGGGARSASDKVFQHNGSGTLTIQNVQASNFSTFYRSCGNCSTQTQRNVVIRNVTLTRPGNRIAGININYGDTARFSGITIVNDPNRSMVICQKYIGNDDGDEPDEAGSGADGTNCLYSSSDITYR